MRRAPLVLLTLLLACPLFAWPGAGFDAVRLPALLILVAALLGTTFVRSARGGERPPGLAPLRTAGLLLLSAHLLSLLAARTLSEAAAPVLILFSGVSIFACLRSGAIRRDEAAGLAPVLSGVAVAAALVGIGMALLKIPFALEGNRNYTGTLAAMLLPPMLALALVGRPPLRWLSAAAGASLAALLVISQSRGGLVAAAAGLLIVGGALGAKRVPRGLAASGVVLLLLVAAVGRFQGREQLSAERMKTAGFRLDVWKSGVRMVLARPVLGWGAGNFPVEYPLFRSESEFRYSQAQPPEGFKEIEDAHSSWVQTAAETGVPGLLAFLLVAYVAARLWRYYLKVAADPGTAVLLAGLGGGAAAYLVGGFFNSLSMKASHTVLFWIFLGLIEVLGDPRPWRPSGRAREWKVAVPAAAAIMALFGALWAGAAGLADAAFTEGMRTANPRLREARMREAIDRNPYSWRAHNELALALFAQGRFAGAAEEGRATLRLRPFHVESLNLTALAVIQSNGAVTEAVSLLKRATEIAPFYFKSFYNLGLLERQRGNRAEARDLLTRALQLEPAFGPAYYHRGAVQFSAGEGALALDDFRKALELGFPVGPALREQLPASVNDSRYAEFFR
jgi:O-antigen ligase